MCSIQKYQREQQSGKKPPRKIANYVMTAILLTAAVGLFIVIATLL